MKKQRTFLSFLLVPPLVAAGIFATISSFARSDEALVVAQAATSSEAGKTAGVTAAQSTITFPTISSQSYQLPPDIPGGANNATLTDAAIFAWQEFIALNWPASPTGVSGSGTRGAPDKSKKFGDDSSGTNQANQWVVWETYRSKVETFPGVGDPPGYSNGPMQDYGFDVAPDYVYGNRSSSNSYQNNPGGSPLDVPACQNPTQPAVTNPAYVNLDEISQIGVDAMFAGVLPSSIATPTPQTANAQPQLIRFLAKGNRTFYDYVAEHQFWYQGQAFVTAKAIFENAAVSNSYPPTKGYIDLPTGTVLVKAAWRPLAPGENASNFHIKTVRFYDKNGGAKEACYREQTWALIALHIIQKTPSAPYFIFATFEYTNNILRPDGLPVEDKNGAEINAPASDGMDPRLNYFDVSTKGSGVYYSPDYPKGIVVPPQPPVIPPPPSLPSPPPSPPLVQVTAPYCKVAAGVSPPATNDRLYFQDFKPNGNSSTPIPPPNEGVCVNKRYFAIPSQVQQVNAAAHAALENYGAPALWQNYKLVNVQWEPFNTGEIDTTGTNTSRLASTYSLANSVVETDNTLQEFFGGVFGSSTAYFKSAFENGDSSSPAYNIYGPPSGSTPSNQFTRTNMGGCMGCHGRAQRAGTDFSFTLSGGPVSEPEFAVPALTTGAAVQANFAVGFDTNRLEKLHRALAGQ